MKEDTSETTRGGWSFWLEKTSQSLKQGMGVCQRI